MEFLCRLSPLQDFPLNEKQYDCIYMEYLRFYSIFQYFCHNQLVLEKHCIHFLCLLIYLLFLSLRDFFVIFWLWGFLCGKIVLFFV